VLGLAGCASTATLPAVPDAAPLAERREARIGVFYPGGVRAAEYRNELVRIPYGETSQQRLDRAFAALFESVTRLPDWPPWRSAPPPVEAVIEVEEGSIAVTLGNGAPSSGLYGVPIPDRVVAAYRACLYRPEGARLTCWDALAEATHLRGMREGAGSSIVRLADRAITDALATLMARIEADPAVRAWAASAGDSPARPAVPSTAQVAIVGWPLAAARRDEVDAIERCLRSAIERELPGVRIVGERRVREALYPLLEPSTQPATEEDFARLLARVDVQLRLGGLGIDRLVAFAGGHSPPVERGAALCSYYGCYGYAWQTEHSRLDAALWDVSAARIRESFEATATGITAIPVVVLPIPLPARTLEQACDRLGQAVASALKAPASTPPRALPQPPAPPGTAATAAPATPDRVAPPGSPAPRG
jgi:hypothetical protein